MSDGVFVVGGTVTGPIPGGDPDAEPSTGTVTHVDRNTGTVTISSQEPPRLPAPPNRKQRRQRAAHLRRMGRVDAALRQFAIALGGEDGGRHPEAWIISAGVAAVAQRFGLSYGEAHAAALVCRDAVRAGVA